METDKTTAYYDEHAGAFARETANADVSGILGEFIAVLPRGASVLDWGCGTGRDSRAMADAGLAVTSTDASSAMCAKAKELFGIDARRERFEELAAESAYDGIWACASLLHVSRADLPSLLQKAKRALRPNGVLYASFKYGNYEGMRGGRWYTDLDEGALAGLVEKDFETVRLWISDDVRPGRGSEKWLNCLLRKRS